jgi:hypothetical protein
VRESKRDDRRAVARGRRDAGGRGRTFRSQDFVDAFDARAGGSHHAPRHRRTARVEAAYELLTGEASLGEGHGLGDEGRAEALGRETQGELRGAGTTGRDLFLGRGVRSLRNVRKLQGALRTKEESS